MVTLRALVGIALCACASRSSLDAPPFVEVALGRGWTCARTQVGGVSCWGESDVLGAEPFPSPSVDDLGRAVRISGGGEEACALIEDGSVRCWGENTGGQLGIDPNQSPPDWIVSTPRVVPDLPASVAMLSTGETFSCVIGAAASVTCFGYVPSNQPPRFDARPVFEIPGGAASVAVSGALWGEICEGAECGGALISGYACALDASGIAWCWGEEMNGNLGDNRAWGESLAPGRVAFDGRFTSIATSSFDACGIDDATEVHCWGQAVLVPTAIDLSHATALAAGDDHMCALRDDGSVWCWGDNSAAQVGVADPTTVLTPTRVQGLGVVVAIGAGTRHSCAVTRDGAVWCWGSNDHGQLGVGGTAKSATPVRAR